MKITKLIASAVLLSIGLSFSNSVIAGEKQKLPFIGDRYFNFMGGSRTTYRINIDKNRNTTIFLDRNAVSTENVVVYKGKFSNLIITNGLTGVMGMGEEKLLLKKDKVYLLDKNGQIIKGCIPSVRPLCEAELSP